MAICAKTVDHILAAPAIANVEFYLWHKICKSFALLSCAVKASTLLLFRTVLPEQFDDFVMSRFSCCAQWCAAVFGPYIDIRTASE